MIVHIENNENSGSTERADSMVNIFFLLFGDYMRLLLQYDWSKTMNSEVFVRASVYV